MRKIQAGALTYAIFIMLISLLITGSIISISYYNRTYIDNEIAKNNLLSYSESIIDAAVSDSTVSFPWDCKECNLNTENALNYNFEVNRNSWGGYYIFTTRVWHREQLIERKYLCGAKGVLNDNIALYFADNNNTLHIAGDTRITGDCILPKTGIKRTYIEGKHYTGDKNIYGNINTSSQKSLPKINENYIEFVRDMLQGKSVNNDSIISFSTLTNHEFENSFYKKTLCLIANEHLYLNNCSFTGNIKIYSNKGITIFPTAKLNNIMIFAPNIYIKQNSSVCIQAYASDTISAENNTTFSFPSVLGIISATNNSLIDIGENTLINGNIWIAKTHPFNKNENTFQLAKNSILNGIAHIEGYTSHKGIIYGSLYTENFVLKTFAGTYKNHLFNAVINVDARNTFYSSAIINKERSCRVIKVLN